MPFEAPAELGRLFDELVRMGPRPPTTGTGAPGKRAIWTCRQPAPWRTPNLVDDTPLSAEHAAPAGL